MERAPAGAPGAQIRLYQVTPSPGEEYKSTKNLYENFPWFLLMTKDPKLLRDDFVNSTKKNTCHILL